MAEAATEYAGQLLRLDETGPPTELSGYAAQAQPVSYVTLLPARRHSGCSECATVRTREIAVKRDPRLQPYAVALRSGWQVPR